MSKRMIFSLSILSSLIFSCAHVVYYDVTFVGIGFSHNGQRKANNLNDYEVTFTANFGYIVDELITVYCGEKELVKNTNYTFNNQKLRIDNNAINASLTITPTIEMGEYTFTHNFSSEELGYDTNSNINITSGNSIDINYGNDIVLILNAKSGKTIPSDDQFTFSPSDNRFFQIGDVLFTDRNEENTHLKVTIPEKLLGCDITFTIPPAR